MFGDLLFISRAMQGNSVDEPILTFPVTLQEEGQQHQAVCAQSIHHGQL